MHRRKIVMALLISLSLVLLAVLTSCVAEATNTPTATTQTQPTVTVIQYVTVTPTVTPTPSDSTIISSPLPTIYPTNYTPTPVSKIQEFNNNHFYITKEIVGVSKEPLPDSSGTFKETPIYKDVYVDLNQAGFKTKADAVFVSPIPTITKHYDWFVRFSLPSAPAFKVPWTLNWGVETVDKDTKADVAFYMIQQNVFEANYYSDPNSLTVYGKGQVKATDRGISELGEHGLTVNDGNGIYVILFRTSNPDNILNWWIKYGGTY